MKIDLRKFGKNLNTRMLAQQIFSKISAEVTNVDFSGVESVTPSFCHEMLTILIIKKQSKMKILNANEIITEQLKKALFVLENDKEIMNKS